MIRSVANRGLFVLTILTGSFLLFLVQPLVARMALPRLGGAPAVWNSAMLVYQALLLGGYAYAHALGRLSLRWQAGVHLGVLLFGAIWLPIGLFAVQPPLDASPVLWVPWLLLGSIGPLFFAVSAQAPLIQRWFGLANDGENPYALYAASNLGSFAGLIAYPLIVEPGLALHNQSWLWTGGYLFLIVLVALCAVRLPRVAAVIVRPTSPTPTLARMLHWTALALVPSGLMLATSTYITTDIVAMPLIWVLPLGLYLLSFSVAFAENRTLADLLTRIAPITVLLFGGVMMGGQNSWPWFNLIVALLLLFMTSVALHTALYRIRPEPDRLTGFYLVMSVGGALGGVFAALIAPLVFDWTYEYPLLILAAGALVPQQYLLGVLRRVWTGQGRFIALACVAIAMGVLGMVRFSGSSATIDAGQQGLLFLALAAIGLAAMGARDAYLIVLAGALILFGGYRSLKLSAEPGARTRSYFGVYTVRDFVNLRELDHGTTVHGIQLTGTPDRERTPTTYYSRGSGVGQAMALAPALYGPGARMAVVGLGTGTLACYAQPGQSWRFYEIDPTVIGIARNSGRFTYLRRCAPQATIRLGDARLSLQAEPPGSLDLLALDAFSSDAVPMHLMTQEAFATYRRVLSARGVLIVHISNRFLDLEPVVAATARTGGWYAAKLNHAPSPLEEQASSSVWIALSRDRNVLATIATTDPGWAPLKPRPGFAPWTDDYSTILPLLK